MCRKTRIINVSSSAHLFGNINLKNPNLKDEYNNWKAYGQSKLANVMFTFELAKRLPANTTITTNTLHPGVVNTELARCALRMIHLTCVSHELTGAMCLLPMLALCTMPP